MTLTTRLTLFFLVMLSGVLAGFSVALYLLAKDYLYRQADERLEAALNTLAAAAEVGPRGVEWEPGTRPLAVGPRAGADRLVWAVTDDAGRVVDRSDQTEVAELMAEAADRLRPAPDQTRRLHWQGEHWLAGQRWVASDRPGPVEQRAGSKHPLYPALVITTAVPLEPVRATLRQLAMALVGTSAGVLLASLFVGRLVCRRALRPVREMASAAREMDSTDLTGRLQAPTTRDELEDLGRAFNGLLDRLQESFERQRRFTGEASHQLRTPLTAVLGQTEVALRRDRTADEYRETLSAVHAKAAHLHRIVEALLFLARADAEARLPDRERVELGAWAAEHLRSRAEHPRASDVRLERHSDTVVWVEVQPALLAELVDILLDNACKYSPPGTPVAVRLGADGGQASLTVEDRGCGIPAADLPHVGEPFFRSADARRRGIGGVGLGLAIARRLAGAFGGTLTVESQEGQGSRFTLSLPARWRAPVG